MVQIEICTCNVLLTDLCGGHPSTPCVPALRPSGIDLKDKFLLFIGSK